MRSLLAVCLALSLAGHTVHGGLLPVQHRGGGGGGGPGHEWPSSSSSSSASLSSLASQSHSSSTLSAGLLSATISHSVADTTGVPSASLRSGWAGTYSPGTAFPTSNYESFYQEPAGTTVEPRPAIVDKVPLSKDAQQHFIPDAGNPTALPTTAPSASPDILPLASTTRTGLAAAPSATTQAIKKLKSDIAKLAATNTSSKDEICSLCKRGLGLGQQFTWSYPDAVPEVLGDLCSLYQAKGNVGKKYATLEDSQAACRLTYKESVHGGAYAQVLSYANLTPVNASYSDGGADSQMICYYTLRLCDQPAPMNFTTAFISDWFSKSNTTTTPSPDVIQRTEAYDAERDALRAKDDKGLVSYESVAHISDIHLDPRSQPGTEAQCTSAAQCCRTDSWNNSVASGPPSTFPGGILPVGNVTEQAKYWGNYHCDSPWSLTASAFEALGNVLPKDKKFAFSLFTGDMVTHEGSKTWHLTRDLLLYVQQGLVDLMSRYLGPGPVMLTLGNHDTVPDDFVPVGNLPNNRAEQLQWEWNHIADLVQSKGWLQDKEALDSVRKHISGFSALVHPGNESSRDGLKLAIPPLRIISLNTDVTWYSGNIYQMINFDDPDRSGTLRWVTDELVAAEQKGEKVWIIGHVLPSWAPGNSWPNPTQLFHILVDRFAPHTLTGLFFGHTHEDQFSVFYPFQPAYTSTQNSPPQPNGANGSAFPIDTAKYAKAIGLMAPSVTPGTNLNPEFRIYTVDPHGWHVMDLAQFVTRLQDVSYSDLSPAPVWEVLYSARETFGHFHSLVEHGAYAGPVKLSDSSWPKHVPLNGTFWGALTDEMVLRPELISLHTALSSGNSTTGLRCTEGDCLPAKLCYFRSGDVRQGAQCIQGYKSVQG